MTHREAYRISNGGKNLGQNWTQRLGTTSKPSLRSEHVCRACGASFEVIDDMLNARHESAHLLALHYSREMLANR